MRWIDLEGNEELLIRCCVVVCCCVLTELGIRHTRNECNKLSAFTRIGGVG